jgi:hypothetical protein
MAGSIVVAGGELEGATREELAAAMKDSVQEPQQMAKNYNEALSSANEYLLGLSAEDKDKLMMNGSNSEYSIVEVSADGHCGIHSVVQQLEDGHSLSSMTVKEARRKVSCYFLKNASHYRNFFPDGESVKDRATKILMLGDGGGKSACFDEAELIILACLILMKQLIIITFTSEGSLREYHAEDYPVQSQKPIIIFLHKKIEHYSIVAARKCNFASTLLLPCFCASAPRHAAQLCKECKEHYFHEACHKNCL